MESSVLAKVEHIRLLCDQLTKSPKPYATLQLISKSDVRLRSELKRLCHEVILVEPEVALKAEIPQLLWNGLVRTTVSAFQKLRVHTIRALGEADWTLLDFLSVEIESFAELVSAFPNVAAFPSSPTSMLLGNLFWCLADLHCIAASRGEPLDEERHYYTRACWFLPGNGSPFNELALLNQREGSHLAAIYCFSRAIGADTPCAAARQHLELLWRREAVRKPQNNMLSCGPEVVLEMRAAQVFIFIGAAKQKRKPMWQADREVAQSSKAVSALASHLQIVNLSLVPRCLWIHLATICIFLLQDAKTSTSLHFANLRRATFFIFKSLAASVRAGSIFGAEAMYITLAWLCGGVATDLKIDVWSTLSSSFPVMQDHQRTPAVCQSTALPVEHDFCGFLGLFRESLHLPSNTDAIEVQKNMLMCKIEQCVHKQRLLIVGVGDTLDALSIGDDALDREDSVLTQRESPSGTISDVQESGGSEDEASCECAHGLENYGSSYSIEEDRSSKRTKTSSQTEMPPKSDVDSDKVRDGGSSSWLQSPRPGGYRDN